MNKGRYWPTFESAFLVRIISSLMKKSKTIKHNVDSFSCNKVYEQYENQKFEKADLEFIFQGANPFRISCSLWEDRCFWLDVRQSAKQGWRFEWQIEGRIGNIDSKRFLEVMLKTVKLSYQIGSSQELTLKLDNLWKPIVSKGPVSLK